MIDSDGTMQSCETKQPCIQQGRPAVNQFQFSSTCLNSIKRLLHNAKHFFFVANSYLSLRNMSASATPPLWKVYLAAFMAQVCWSGQMAMSKVTINSGIDPVTVAGFVVADYLQLILA